MSNASPFSGTRFEFEYRHLYFLQEDRYARLEQPKPCILIGSRGTGKTTLLRSLSWRERLQNEGLRRQLGDRGFKNYIGVYIKLPDVQLDAIAQWLETADPIIRRALFSRYLELIQLQEILDAVSDLEAAGELQFPADRERAEVRAILDEFGDEVFAPDGGTREPKSLSDLANSMRRLRRIIEKRSQERASTQEAFNSVGSPHQISLLSRRVCERLSRLISKNAKAPIIFKVCFDEAETLDPYGIKILATWIRLAAIPLFHVFSFVSKPETFSETFLPGLTTQSADVAEIDLDGVPNARFREFVEGVTTLRLEEVWKDTASPVRISRRQPFKTEAHFGKLNINSLLEDILRDSVSPLAKEILNGAQARTPSYAHASRGKRGDDESLPIYETYLEIKTKRRIISDASTPKWKKRKAESQYQRKQMVSAYLSLLKELDIRPSYASADMIVQLSDACVRDYLNNLEYIFRASNKPLSAFISNKKVPATIQSAGLISASKAKFQSLPIFGVNHPSSTARLVRGLGELTQRLQTSSGDGLRHLKTTERGIFSLPVSSTDPTFARAMRLVVDAAEAGFLKKLPEVDTSNPRETAKLRFRVHTSLAPAFGFSYRGAYYDVELLALDILAFADATTDADIDKLVKELFTRIDGGNKDLFSGRKS